MEEKDKKYVHLVPYYSDLQLFIDMYNVYYNKVTYDNDTELLEIELEYIGNPLEALLFPSQLNNFLANTYNILECYTSCYRLTEGWQTTINIKLYKISKICY